MTGVTPTPAGKYFYQQADHVTQEVKRVKQQAASVIHVGTSLLRPGNDLVRLWLKDQGLQKKFTLQLVPFVDQFAGEEDKILTPEMDCLVTPYSVKAWRKSYD